MNANLFVREIDIIEDEIAALRIRLAQLKEVEAYANTAIASVADAIKKIQIVGAENLDKFQDAIAALFPTKFAEQHPVSIEEYEEYPEYLEYPIEDEQSDTEYLEEPEEEAWEQGEGRKGKEELTPIGSFSPQPPAPCSPSSVTHTSPHGSFEVIKISESVAYCRNNRENSIQCAYAGFNNKLRAEQWGKYLVDRNIINRFEIRPAQRLEGFKYELKVWNINIDSIKLLAQKDLSRVPAQDSFPAVVEVSVRVCEASRSEASPIAEEEARASLGLPLVPNTEYEQGNWVKYEGETLQISEIYSDGTLSLESPNGYILVHKSEVEPAWSKPSNWHPFNQVPAVSSYQLSSISS